MGGGEFIQTLPGPISDRLEPGLAPYRATIMSRHSRVGVTSNAGWWPPPMWLVIRVVPQPTPAQDWFG